MIYNVDINSDNKTPKLGNNIYYNAGFTLTVKAVNDAPVLLQPLEGLEILEGSGVAALVFSTYSSTNI